MELVKALTRTMNSITVCATIHSPSPQTFELFDKVIILLSGRIVYFGNNGERLPQATAPKSFIRTPPDVLHVGDEVTHHHPVQTGLHGSEQDCHVMGLLQCICCKSEPAPLAWLALTQGWTQSATLRGASLT